MDAGRSKPQTQTQPQPPRPMDAGSTTQSRIAVAGRAEFNTRNVTREDNAPCKLTVYLDYGHSFVRLENKERNVDIARGLYPDGYHPALGQEMPSIDTEGCHHPEVELDAIFQSDTCPANPLLPQPKVPDPMCEVPLRTPWSGATSDQCAVPEVECEEPEGGSFVTSIGADSERYLGSVVAAGGVKSSVGKPLGIVSSTIGVSKLFREEFGVELGDVMDEVSSYEDYNGIDHIPKVTFFISQQEAMAVEQYITEYSDACHKKEASCVYSGLGFNCVDFAQEAFSKTGYPGHYIEYFTPKLLEPSMGYATAYAALYHPMAKPTIGGTLMLAAVAGKYAVPKLAGAVKTVGSWMSGWVWPEQKAVEEEKVDVSETKRLFNSVKYTNLTCERFWENYKKRNDTTTKLISESVDLQARFDDLERLIASEGFSGRHQAFIHKELKSIQEGFDEFFEQANDMKKAQNSNG
ncbi:hypothetical protein [Endozoicomonas numazuensis]|uniref:Uncharacterized protein n=1 Tax=Endozoicomonas numazuensis TaxID=1137799 RepID=A0A081NK38_9GAMM|nr:hypothetical protein [Endozoicomonas numazuensis]KEQ18811.1 hypothetical protein GZ78_01640 [Endozoicomonas numazuensis]